MVYYLALVLALLFGPANAQTYIPPSAGGGTITSPETFNAGAPSLVGARTGKWWANDSPPANELRWKDKALFGDAATNYPNTSGSGFLGNSCASGDWFSTFQGTTLPNGTCAYTGVFQVVVESDASNANASGGLLAAAQSKNATTQQGTLGLTGFAINNSSANLGFGAWGIYAECDSQNSGSNLSQCIGNETDNANFVSDGFAGSPDPFTQSAVVNYQAACGGGYSSPTVFKCGAGIQFVNNANAFKVGISFLNTSVTSQSLLGTTVSPAISMPTNYGIIWYSAAGTSQGGIEINGSNSLVLDASATISLIATNLVINGTSAVSCASGTVNGATVVVVDGIITHC